MMDVISPLRLSVRGWRDMWRQWAAIAPGSSPKTDELSGPPTAAELAGLLAEVQVYLRSPFGFCMTCSAVASRTRELELIEHAPDCLQRRVAAALHRYAVDPVRE